MCCPAEQMPWGWPDRDGWEQKASPAEPGSEDSTEFYYFFPGAGIVVGTAQNAALDGGRRVGCPPGGQDIRPSADLPGYDGGGGRDRAISEMGNVTELGKELAKIHKPWLGWLWAVSCVLLWIAGIMFALGILVLCRLI